jgi:hypothetical protein
LNSIVTARKKQILPLLNRRIGNGPCAKPAWALPVVWKVEPLASKSRTLRKSEAG